MLHSERLGGESRVAGALLLLLRLPWAMDRSDYLPAAKLQELAQSIDPRVKLEPDAEQVRALHLSRRRHL